MHKRQVLFRYTYVIYDEQPPRRPLPLDELWKAEEEHGYVPTPRRLEILQGQIAGLGGIEQLQLDSVASYCDGIFNLEPPKYHALRKLVDGVRGSSITVADEPNRAAMARCGIDAPMFMPTQTGATAATHVIPFMTGKLDVNYSILRGVTAQSTVPMLYPQELPLLERLMASESEMSQLLADREATLRHLNLPNYAA